MSEPTNKDPAAAFQHFLAGLGVELSQDPELDGTPERVAGLFAELFAGRGGPPPEIATIVREGPETSDPVVVASLPFHSMCVHHMVPFFGEIAVAYVPDKRLVGFGSIPRIIRHFSARPQLQERLVEEIAGFLDTLLEPRGVLVYSRARQLCVEMRGERQRADHTASASRGILQQGPVRAEVLAQIR